MVSAYPVVLVMCLRGVNCYYVPCILSGFKHFTDDRCFHFCRRDIIHLGRTLNVGICECKPDAMAQVWGDTKLRPGLQLFLV